MKSTYLFIAAAFFSTEKIMAQESAYYTKTDQYLDNLAENLYDTKILEPSKYLYSKFYFYNDAISPNKKEAAQFFDNVIGVMLEKEHAEVGLETFIKEYPTSAYFAKATMPLADYYLSKKEFSKALKSLNKINQAQLSSTENTSYLLKLGYAKFMLGDQTGAIRALEAAKESANPEQINDVYYMLGHLYYEEKNNEKAFQYFDIIRNTPKYVDIVKPYYAQLYYNEGRYLEAIDACNELLNVNNYQKYDTEIHKIIGESYFMLNKYREAYPHLLKFIQAQENPSDVDLYEMGYVCAQMDNHKEAISYYNKLINKKSQLTQNAYYQLGNSYLEEGKKEEALSAFRSSYQMNYDQQVKELAHQKYAKLGYEIGNPFENPSKVIESYLKDYPNSKYNGEMSKLLVKSYLYSGNYQETLDAIDRLTVKDEDIKEVDHEVSFLLGTEEYNKGNWEKAKTQFLRSLSNNYNPTTQYRATYWLGQTYYQLGDYASALQQYQKLSGKKFLESSQLDYDMGYALYKLKNFDKAKDKFKSYLNNPDPAYANDAKLRLADCYYAENDLNKAIDIYNNSDDISDYALYQKAMAYGFQGNQSKKIETLQQLLKSYPTSEYKDQAKLEEGIAYATAEQYSTSNDVLDELISDTTNYEILINARIYRALNEADLGQTQEAYNQFNDLAYHYKNTGYADKVLLAAKPMYVENGNVNGYKELASQLNITIDDAELDNINLSSAQNLYTKKEYKKAIPQYEKYLTNNPKGEKLYQSMFEMGDCLYQTQSYPKAVLTLQQVAENKNPYQEQAQTRMAQIFLEQGNNDKAKKYLEPLQKSNNESIRSFANERLMNIYAEEGNDAMAEKTAEMVLENSKISKATAENAKAILARSLMKQGKDRQARTAYLELEKSVNASVAAEALYAKAYYQNKDKNYKASNQTIFKIANNYAAEEYWGAKALVVMAKNYWGLKDRYQASYTCDQIIENYQDFPDVVSEAKAVKKTIR